MPASELCAAIAGRRLLRLTYGGGERTVEPHGHGWGADGTELLLAYQRAGFSSSGASTGWKMLRVANASRLHVEEGTFEPRAEFSRDDPRFARICCAV